MKFIYEDINNFLFRYICVMCFTATITGIIGYGAFGSKTSDVIFDNLKDLEMI